MAPDAAATTYCWRDERVGGNEEELRGAPPPFCSSPGASQFCSERIFTGCAPASDAASLSLCAERRARCTRAPPAD